MNDRTPLVRTPNGDDDPRDHAIGVLLTVLLVIFLAATAVAMTWDMTHPQVRTVQRHP